MAISSSGGSDISNQMNKLFINKWDVRDHHIDVLKFVFCTSWSERKIVEIFFRKGEVWECGGDILIITKARGAYGKGSEKWDQGSRNTNIFKGEVGEEVVKEELLIGRDHL